uniref:Uncharacterized protein n=1 Tax=Timema monikensis TaxID=170555 RepID=A0A7R9HVB1_9NEOP|nr:unnamed protein product [Timema monikensis]
MEDEGRQRKVEAGREMFVAYKKKKSASKNTGDAKKKKKNEEHMEESLKESSDSSFSNDSFRLSLSVTPDGPKSIATGGAKEEMCDKLQIRVAELEDMLAGKSAALEALSLELEALNESSRLVEGPVGMLSPVSVEQDYKTHLEEYRSRLLEFQAAVTQRDGLIEQLSSSLQSALSTRDTLQLQGEQLAQEVALLQKQLQATMELVQGHHWDTGIQPDQFLTLQNKMLSLEALVARHQSEAADLNRELEVRDGELASKTQDLARSKTKAAQEVQKLMGEVEDLQQRAARASLDHEGKLAKLRAELEENFGLQLGQIKEELRNQFESEMHTLEEKHSKELSSVQLAHQAYVQQVERYIEQLNIDSPIGKIEPVIDPTLKLQLEQLGHDKLVLNRRLENVTEESQSLKRRLEELTQNNDRLRCELGQQTERDKFGLDCVSHPFVDITKADEKLSKELLELRTTCSKDSTNANKYSIEELELYKQNVTTLTNQLQQSLQTNERLTLELIQFKDRHKVESDAMNKSLQELSEKEKNLTETIINLKKSHGAEILSYIQQLDALNTQLASLKTEQKSSINASDVDLENMKHSYELELVSYKQVIDSLNERLIEALQAEDNFPKVLAAHVVNFQADIVKYKEKIDALNVQLQESLKTERNHIKLLEAKEVELFVSKEQIEKLTATLEESSNMEVYLKTQIDSLNKQLQEALSYETEKQNKLLDSQIKESINVKLTDVEIQTYKEEINSLNIKLKEFLNIKEEARTHSSLIVTLKAQLQEVLNENSRYKDELNLSKCQIVTLTSECQTLSNLHEGILSLELENKALKLKLDEISKQKEELSSVNAKQIQDLEENLKKMHETEKTKTKEVEYLTHCLESKIRIEEEYKDKTSALELELASFKNQVIASDASGGSLKLCQQEIVTLKERLAESHNEENKHIKEIAACQMEAQSYKQQVELLDSRFAEELASNMVEIEELSGKLVDHAIAQNKVKLLEEVLKNKEDEMDLVMQELQSYKEKVQQLKQSDILYSQSVEKEVEIQMLQAQTSELNSCKEQIQVYQDRLKQFEDLIEVLSNSLVEKESEVKVFKEQSSHEMSFKQQVFLCEQRLQQFEGLTQQVKDVTSKLVDKEACIASLQEQCSNLQSCKERLESCEEKLKLFYEMEKNFGIITSQLAEKDNLVKELQKSTLDGKKLNDLLEDMNEQVEILTSQLVEKDIFITKLEEKLSNTKLNKELVLKSTSTNVETATPHSSGMVNDTQHGKGDFIYLESSKEQNDNLNKQLKEALASKDLYSKEVEALTSFLDENASEKEALQKEISILHQELESKKVYEKKNEDLNKQLLEQINILNGNLSSNADTKTRLEQEVKEFQKKLNSIIGEKIELNNMLTERIKTEEYLTAEAISQQANAIAYKEQFEYLKVELQEQLSEVGLAHAEDLSTLRREVQQLTELNIELSGSEEELQSKVQYLTNMNRNLRMEVSGLKELSESLRSQLQDFTAQNLNYESLLEGQREVETDFQVALKEQMDKSSAELQEMTVQYLKAEGLLSAKEELQVSMAEHISQLEASLANVNQSLDSTNKQYLLKIAKAKELLKRLKIEKEEASNKVVVLEKLCESLKNENHNLTVKNRELSELLKENKDMDNVNDCVTDKNTSTREKRSTTIEPYVANTIQIKNLEQEKEELVCQLNKAFEEISFLNIQHHELSQAHSECTQLRSENIQLQSKLSEKELLEHELIGGLATAKAQYDQLNQTVLLLEAGFKEVEEENGKTFQAQEALKLQLTEEKDKVLKLSQLKAELESQLSSFEKECKAATELRVVLEHQLLDCLTKEDGVELLILSNSTYAKEGIVLREKVLALQDELKVVEMKNAKITRELEIAWQVQKDGEETFAVLKKDLGLLELENKQLLKQEARKSAAVSSSEGQDILESLISEKSILTTINMAADKKDTREIDIFVDKEMLDETNYTKGYKRQKLDEKNIDLDVQGSGHGLEKDELTFLNMAAGGLGLNMESDEAILDIGAKQESRKVINIGTDKTLEISRKLEAVLKRNTDLIAEKESLLEKLQMQQSPLDNLQVCSLFFIMNCLWPGQLNKILPAPSVVPPFFLPYFHPLFSSHLKILCYLLFPPLP